MWTLDADNVLRLTYDNRDLADRQYTLSRRGVTVTMIELERRTEADMVAGNKLPYT